MEQRYAGLVAALPEGRQVLQERRQGGDVERVRVGVRPLPEPLDRVLGGGLGCECRFVLFWRELEEELRRLCLAFEQQV